MLLFGVLETSAQIAMPDTVCVGTIRTYSVNDPTVPSTYTWQIDGVTQTITTNAITITWNTAGQFLITVQERSAEGCDGDIQSGIVYVYPPAATNQTITIYGRIPARQDVPRGTYSDSLVVTILF